IVWSNQRSEVLRNIPANIPLLINYQNASGSFQYTSYFKPTGEEFVPAGITSSWQHKENEFWDYNVQYLIPHAQSTRGPKIAIADVNNDGLDDMYACGAKDQPGALLIQQANSLFTPTDTSVFNIDRPCEDVDAAFFDADGDNDMDLFVVSGGNQPDGNSGKDRLYLNDGKGHFIKENDFTSPSQNKSCVAIADIDKDG